MVTSARLGARHAPASSLQGPPGSGLHELILLTNTATCFKQNVPQ